MILSTVNDLPGYEITEVLGEVFGVTPGDLRLRDAVKIRPVDGYS
jgi:uncharacterized protein YbjQ (UPF0145 family)